MKAKHLTAGLLAFLLAAASTAAFANDQVVSTVTNLSGGPQAVIVNNGVPSGTIQLWYAYVGTSFPCGQFAQVNLGLQDVAGTNGKAPNYPVELDLEESGNGTPVQFSPDPSVFSVTGTGWSGNSTVTVNIDCSNLPTTAPYDGQEIVGNLNESTNPSGSHLDTISTIQAHIKLVFPAPSACLRLYSFQTDQGSGTLLSAVSVVEHNGSVKSTNPGTISVDGLVVNTCSFAETLDLGIGGIGPGQNWQTQPNNNPGNATFSYNEAGEVDNPTVSFDFAGFGNGAPQGEVLCLPNVTLAAGDSYLATVHSAITSPLSLPTTPGNFNFSASLYSPNTACQGSLLDSSIASPNVANSTLPYTVKSN